jgi:hypothetical protein
MNNSSLCKKCYRTLNPKPTEPIFEVMHRDELITAVRAMSEEERASVLTSRDGSGYSWMHFLLWKYITCKHHHKDPKAAIDYLSMAGWVLDECSDSLVTLMMSDGLPEDDKCTPMHYFVKSLHYLNKVEFNIAQKFRRPCLRQLYDSLDGDGMSVKDYINRMNIKDAEKMEIYRKHKEMKLVENQLFLRCFDTFPKAFRTCDVCHKPLSLFDDVSKLSPESFIGLLEEDLVEVVITLRRDIAKCYGKEEDRAHVHCIETWEKVLSHLRKYSTK